MAWETVTCDKCGAEFDVQMYGKSSDREWKIDNWSWICDDCKEKDRTEKIVKSRAEAQDMGLPELIGSPKQIAWAETIRIKILNALAKHIKQEVDNGQQQEMDRLFQHICTIFESRFWIDYRSESPGSILIYAARAVPTNDDITFEKEAEIEAILRPESTLTETIAEISIISNNIKIRFPERRDDFREIVKYQHYFRWDGSNWVRTMRAINPTPFDKVAELGAVLLKAGFPVRIFDEKIREQIINDRVERENTRLICAQTKGEYKGWFAIQWRRRDGDFYQNAKRLPGARYNKPAIVIPSEHFEEVLDFAETEGFKLTEGAGKLLVAAREAKEKTLVVDPKLKDSPKPKSARPNLHPEEAGDIDPELMDDF